MDYKEEKDYLKKIFPEPDFSNNEEENAIRFKRRSILEIHFLEKHLISLKKYLKSKDEIEIINFETSLVTKNYREELVDVINHTNSRLVFWRDEKYVFGTEDKDSLYSIIDRCSDNYIWNKLGNENFRAYFLDRFRFIGRDNDFFEYSKRLFTIKVYNTGQSNAESNLKYTNSIVDSCIFSFSSLKQTTISLVESFPQRRRLREQNKDVFKIQSGNSFNLPKIKINGHLLKFYQLASSTDFASHKFLSYYHILEYFFLTVSDQNLYDKLSRRINDPKFRTNSPNLDKLINDVNSHKSENDETEMLKGVLQKFINEDEIIEFVKEYETLLDDNIYTKKKNLFGVEVAGTNLQIGHIFGPIAKRIKTIRNAIVHSSDRHERNVRFIPYSKASMDIVKDEIPLLKFIAEKIIVASAE